LVIDQIDIFILKAPLGDKAFYSSQGYFTERSSLLVRIRCSDGTEGWGEGGQYGPPEPPATCIRDVLGPRLIGRNPEQPGVIFEELYAFSRDFGQKGAYIDALSAIDIALWDIFGKSVGRPVHALLGGGFRDRVKAYGTGCYYPTDYARHTEMLGKLEKEVEAIRATGVGAVKMKVGLLPVRQDIERMRLVRSTLGDEVDLMVDANHAYSFAPALKIGRAAEEIGALWLEEPVVPEDRAAYRRLRDQLDIAIAGGECEFTRYGFRDLLAEQCVDIAQPDLCAAGGFTEWRNILTLASCFGVQTIPHVWGSGVAVAAATHALAIAPLQPHTAAPVALQNEPMIEFDRTYNPLRDDLLETPFTVEDECLAIPQGPGLGVSVNEEVLARFTVQEDSVRA
jgi:D-galactarolactone cycloisomerase